MNVDKTAGAQASAADAVTVDDKAAGTDDKAAKKPEGDEAEDGEEADKPASDAAEGDDKPDGEADDDAEDGEGKPPRTKAQRNREARKRKLSALHAEVQRLSELVASGERNKPVAGELGPKPERAKYEDEAEYVSDLSAWKTEERILARQTKAHETTSTAVRGDAAAAKMTLFKERAMALTDRYPDIEAKVFNDQTLPMSAVMADVLMESEKGPEVAYYLSANREVAQRIKEMQPLAAARELGRIEATVSLPKTRTETKAPPPPTIVSGSGGSVNRKTTDASGDGLSTEEWAKRERARVAAKRKA